MAKHYLDTIRSLEYEWEVFGIASGRGSRFAPYADQRICTIGDFLGRDALSKALAPVHEKWNAWLADVKESCHRAGVDDVWDLDPAVLSKLLAEAGFVAIPVSELRPMDELLDRHRWKDPG